MYLIKLYINTFIIMFKLISYITNYVLIVKIIKANYTNQLSLFIKKM